MGPCDEMLTTPQVGEVNFHRPPALAALLAILTRNAKSSERDFANFACQVEQTMALAEELKRNGVRGADQFHTIATHVKTFLDESEENRELFRKAHEAIRDVLVKLPTDDWGPCNYVSHASLAQIISL